MNSTLKAASALTLALLVAIPASGESLGHSAVQTHQATAQAVASMPDAGIVDASGALVEKGHGLGKNPPSSVRQPGRRTRLIVAIAFVGGLAGLALWVCGHGGCGR